MSVRQRVAASDQAHGGWRALLVILACVGALLAYGPLWAQADDTQDTGHAGLVIVKSDGRVLTQCIALPRAAEEGITGYDLIAASGLKYKAEVSGMGAAICSLDGEGCDFPRQACQCQCQGSPCNYWSYWQHGAAGEWIYSNLGAVLAEVVPGTMQAWVWGNGSAAQSPPPLQYADVCNAAGETILYASAVTAAATLPAEAVAVSVQDASTLDEVAPEAEAVAEPPVVASSDDAPVAETGGSNLLVALGLLLIPLLLLLGAFLVIRKPNKPTS